MEILHSPALGDRYLICELLGSGGMAEVHRARDLRLDRSVAVKVLRPELAADPVQRVRFGREARAAASLNHPGIVAVFDSGEGAGRTMDLPYLVMEYLPGRTLARVLTEDGPQPPQQALHLTAEILDALDHAHRHGMIHRDVKPANVMVGEDGAVKLMDFGIARSTGGPAAHQQTLTEAGMVIGTADYLSPEQARGAAADARTDLYAVGCLLHELLTGVPPLLADSPLETVWRRLREDAPPPSLLAPALPPELDALVCRALAREPGERWASAADMREAVLDLLDLLDRRSAQAQGGAAEGAEFAQQGAAVQASLAPVALAGAAGPRTPTLVEPAVRSAPPSGPRAAAAAGAAPAGPSRGAPSADARAGRRRRSRGGLWAGAAGVALVACLGGFWAFGSGVGSAASGAAHGGPVRLPALTQHSLAHARLALKALGLRLGPVHTGSCHGSAFAPRTVCAQQPAAGTTLARGSTVELTVSRAPGLGGGLAGGSGGS